MIPMVDLKTQYHQLKDEIDAGLLAALENTAFVMGPNVQAFEKEAAEYLGVKHAIGVANGTEALHLALLAAGIGQGDEVITSAFTFIATAEAIRYVGAKPVFVDIDPRTFNITPATVEAAITPQTKAIMPVHLFGQPVDIAGIQAVAHKHGLKIVEDCAQSFGASVDGKQTGGFGLASGFSFFPSKNLGAYGDGGLVTTNDDDVAAKVKVLRNHGSEVRYYHDVIGYNSRLDELQAVILRVKLKRIAQFNEGRRRSAHLYSELLAGLVETPYEDGIGVHVYHQYTLLSDRRDAIQAALQNAQIACAVYYPVPLHQQKVFAADCQGVSLPVTEAVAARCLSLPIFPELAEEQVREVVGVIRSALGA
ncbi:DegT/DnrJ/EryC1/StrS aminotransferase family protein [Methylococcus sp. EFPC2]|uniref:DegT/DnrJ/EryC1/StrS family aminotransferase n=1 Tax=Methylococcus sp. EFPC2 TaxID=2812648 RepID=UPI0019683FFF|nr:DegT/DnrJ/EryC1/StrS family aminotransferase [Methylococcus sp. EFPC2]QSA97158.1 DegT/DnrJ/EryC1/StrS family aminotransferase [Methylococcus sp. EFPC2]